MSDAVGGNSSWFKRLRASFRVADRPNFRTSNVRWGQAIGLLVALVAALGIAGAAAAQPRLVPPRSVVLYVHADLKDDAFVEPLVCELQRVLVAPVRAQTLALAIGPEVMASATQVDVGKLTPRLAQTTREDGGPETFKFLLTPHDLTGGNYRYVFGGSVGGPYNSGIVSTARLAPIGDGRPRGDAARLTMERTYKIILRYVAQLSGYRTAEGCVLAFPRGLGELDAKSSEFCADDRALLVEAGVLKAKPFGACNTVAMASR
jgi:predicted Zn-dependent protease